MSEQHILDEWPRCPICGKSWKMNTIGLSGPTEDGFYKSYTYHRLLPDCDCPVAETEGKK